MLRMTDALGLHALPAPTRTGEVPRRILNHPWVRQALREARAEGYAAGVHDTTIGLLTYQHRLDHRDLPADFVRALQDDQESTATVEINGTPVTITSDGSRTPAPDSRTIWHAVCAVVHTAMQTPGIEHMIAILPSPIKAISWTNGHGQRVVIAPARRAAST